MDNLDFGWQFGLIVLAIMAVIYFLLAFANYGLMLLLTTVVKSFAKATFWKNKELTILQLLIIFLPIVLIAQRLIGFVAFDIVTNANGQIKLMDAPGGVLLWETYFFYANGWILRSLEIICLLLFRYDYDIDGTILKLTKWSRRITSIWLFVLITLNLRWFHNYLFSEYLYFEHIALRWLVLLFQIGVYVGFTYWIIKKRNWKR